MKHQRPHDSPWLWLALVGGSIATHLVLAIIVLPFSSRLSTAAPQPAYTSISLVELPYTETSKTSAKAPAKASAKAPATLSKPALPSASTKSAEPLSSSADQAIGLDPAKPPRAADRPAASPTMPSLPALPPVARPLPSPASSPVAPGAPAADSIAPAPDPAIAPPAVMPLPPPVSPSPQIATEPITVPVPQVPESSPVPAASPLPQVIVNAKATPPRLTANLKFDHLPPTEVGVLPETLAAPKNGVSQQTFTDIASSACLELATPEADQFLGKTVALQVVTNVRGQVTSTRVRQSSQNNAYDKLAQCIITHWEFEPARVKSLPVPSNALLVQVTLEQD